MVNILGLELGLGVLVLRGEGRERIEGFTAESALKIYYLSPTFYTSKHVPLYANSIVCVYTYICIYILV